MDQAIRRASGFGRLAAGALAASFIAYLFLLSPHLVHHLFDQEQERPSCAVLAQSQGTPGLQTVPASLTPPGLIETLPPPIRGALPPAADVTAGHPRAPPVLALSA